MTIYTYENEKWIRTKFKTLEELWDNYSEYAVEDELQRIYLDSMDFHIDGYYYTDKMGHTFLFINDRHDLME